MAEVSPILDSLERRNHTISIDSVVNGKLEEMIERGLKVMALCNDGTGRSHRVAEELSKKGIPAVSLEEGLKTIDKSSHLYPYLLDQINKVPMVAIVLTIEEQGLFNGILQNLRAHRYTSSDSAIESLTKMAA